MEIALLEGGRSPEREISLKTGKALGQALKELGHHVTGIDPARDSLEVFFKQSFDFAFIALHGQGGEDGTIQGFLETLGLPFNGSGVLASALCMDKIRTKECFLFHGLPTPDYLVLDHFLSFDEVVSSLGSPFILKPACLGSTIGVALVSTAEDYKKAYQSCQAFHGRIFAEKYVPGQEITIALLGQEVLPLLEIETETSFFDYRAKYEQGRSKHYIPPRLPQEVVRQAGELSLRAQEVTGCTGLIRIDARVDKEGKIFLLEINTLPGLTEISLVPEAARAAGISYLELVQWMLEDGFKEKEKRKG